MFWNLIFRNKRGVLRCKRTVGLMFFTVLFSVCFVCGVEATETRQHGAHVHGIGQLNVVLDGDELVVELESPGANIVGFEHGPENEQQSHAVHEAVELLEDGVKLFALPADAQCTLHEASIESEMAEEHHEEEVVDHQEDDQGHSGHEHDTGADHSEFQAMYHFNCVHPDKLKTIDVLLFSYFPGFEELEVQLITPTKKTAVELTPKEFQLFLQ